MIIPELSSRKRNNPDPWYHSRSWTTTRTSFREGFTRMPDGVMLSNKFCYDCYIEHKMKLPGRQTDHVLAIKAGGHRTDHSNLRTLCDSHHAKKSANEGK